MTELEHVNASILLLNATLTTMSANIAMQNKLLAQLVHDEKNHAAVVMGSVELVLTQMDALPSKLATMVADRRWGPDDRRDTQAPEAPR